MNETEILNLLMQHPLGRQALEALQMRQQEEEVKAMEMLQQRQQDMQAAAPGPTNIVPENYEANSMGWLDRQMNKANDFIASDQFNPAAVAQKGLSMVQQANPQQQFNWLQGGGVVRPRIQAPSMRGILNG